MAVLSNAPTTNEIEATAKQELLESMKKSLDTNFHNPAYTKEGYYEHLSKSVLYHENQLYFRAFVVRKTVIEPIVYKPVKSSEKTIAKNKFRRMLKAGKIREFRVDLSQISVFKVNGNVITIE